MAWDWPDSLDALVAAPAFHRLVLETDDVRVVETVIGPGETVPLHTHRWPSVIYVLANSDAVRRDHEGAVLTDSPTGAGRPEPGSAVWTAPMPPHTVENVGDSEIRLAIVELKRD
jgi:predicted metal-dependent enzyme (double-stranded beta helix superfamily)